MPRRRRPRRRHRPRVWRGVFRLALPFVVPVLAGILAINGAVRSLGGEVAWLSIERLSERADALARLGQHHLRIWTSDSDSDPKAALRAAALRHGVPVSLVMGVARAESDFVPTRISGTGAMGLMQLMPATADELSVLDPFDAEQSADGGARYLARLLRSYRGDLRRALAAYNAGPARVPVQGPLTLPQETRGYVTRITAGL